MYTIPLIRLGNHWYPNLKHENPEDLILDSKLEKLISQTIVGREWYSPVIYLYEITGFMPESGILEINDDDIERYLNTDDNFDLRVTVDGHKYKLSSGLYSVLEDNFNLELCKTTYKIEIW